MRPDSARLYRLPGVAVAHRQELELADDLCRLFQCVVAGRLLGHNRSSRVVDATGGGNLRWQGIFFDKRTQEFAWNFDDAGPVLFNSVMLPSPDFRPKFCQTFLAAITTGRF